MPKKLELDIEDLIGKNKALPEGAVGNFEKTNEETIFKLNSVSEVISEMAIGFDQAAVSVVEDVEEIDNDNVGAPR